MGFNSLVLVLCVKGRAARPPGTSNGHLFAALFLVSSLYFSFTTSVRATITEVDQLDFGTIALSPLTGVQVLSITYDGIITADADIHIVVPGNPGEWLLTNFPVSTTLTVDLPNSVTLSRVGGGNPDNFTVKNLETEPSTVTDGTGAFTLHIGGDMETTSGGPSYIDGDYEGSFDITINF